MTRSKRRSPTDPGPSGVSWLWTVSTDSLYGPSLWTVFTDSLFGPSLRTASRGDASVQREQCASPSLGHRRRGGRVGEVGLPSLGIAPAVDPPATAPPLDRSAQCSGLFCAGWLRACVWPPSSQVGLIETSRGCPRRALSPPRTA